MDLSVVQPWGYALMDWLKGWRFMDPSSTFIPLEWTELDPATMMNIAQENYERLNVRRTTRHFSSRNVDRRLIELAIQSGSTAPSGAHLQPWTWVAIRSADLQAKLREAAEKEEQNTYAERMPEAWSEVLEPLGTDAIKPHLTDAPWIVCCSSRKSACEKTANGGQPTTQRNRVVLRQACSFKPCTPWVSLRSPTRLPPWDFSENFSVDRGMKKPCL